MADQQYERVRFGGLFSSGSFVIALALVMVGPGCGKASGGDGATAATGTGPSTDGATTGEDLPPHAIAALAACEALETVEPIELPRPDDTVDFFFGEFPARFLAHIDDAIWGVYENLNGNGTYWCHWLGGVDGDWSPATDWFAPDGEVRTYIFTRDVNDVLFHGSDAGDGGGPSPPGPLTQAVALDVSGFCPDLPTAWIPDPDIPAEEVALSGICMKHAQNQADIVFVHR